MRSLVLVLLISGSMAWAEEPQASGLPLTVGTKVRVRAAAPGEPLVGWVTGVDEQDLTLSVRESAPMKIPRDSISVADMSVGRRGHALQGLLIGAALGAAVGLAIPVDPVLCKSDPGYACSRGEILPLTIVAEAGAGALIGHFIKTDRWARVEVAAGVALGRPRIGLALGLRF